MEIFILFHERNYIIRTVDIACFNVVWTDKETKTKALLKIYGLGCAKKDSGATRISTEKCKISTQMKNVALKSHITSDVSRTAYSKKDDLAVLGDFIHRIFNGRNVGPTRLTTETSYDILRPLYFEAFKAVQSLLGNKENLASVADLRYHPLWWTDGISYEFVRTLTSIIDMQDASMQRATRDDDKSCKIPLELQLSTVLGDQQKLKDVLKPQRAENWLLTLTPTQKAELETHNKTGKPVYQDGTTLTGLVKCMRHSVIHPEVKKSAFDKYGIYNFVAFMRRQHPRLMWTLWDMMKVFAKHHDSLAIFYPPNNKKTKSTEASSSKRNTPKRNTPKKKGNPNKHH